MAKLLDYIDSLSLMNKYKITTPRAKYVNSVDEALDFYSGKRIALKVLSDKALHKSKSGVIELNLETEHEIGSAFNRLNSKAIKNKLSPFNIIAQEMSEEGLEVIIGGNTDSQFGKLVLIGLGGIYVEVFKDFAIRTCPINGYDALSMLNQLKSKSIIAPNEKYRNLLSKLLLSISKLLEENKDIVELDLNPIILNKGGYSAVDIRILK